jgi:hypothetical protein
MKRIISSAALGLISLWMAGVCQPASASPTFQTAKSNGTEVDPLEIGDRIPLILVHGVRQDSSVWDSFVDRFWRTQSDIRSNFNPD